ncbi:hypothetical protein GEMRC1_003757 [Eukaryota sp. GEM-RC1]
MGRGRAGSIAPTAEPSKAILVASSFSSYYPLADEHHEGLLPMINTKAIDYSLEALENSGVDEIIVVCAGPCGTSLGAYLNSSPWTSPTMHPKVKPIIRTQGLVSIVDAIKQVDESKPISGDVILMDGCVVTNARLADILECHKAKVQANSSVAATVCFFSSSDVSTRGVTNQFLPVIDSDCNLVSLVHPSGLPGQPKNLRIQRRLFLENRNFTIANDLSYSGIAVISPQFLTSAFEFIDARDFCTLISSILASDLLSIKISTITSKFNDYLSFRVDSLPNFLSLQLFMAKRWLYPLAPEVPIGHSSSGVRFSRLGIYKGYYVNYDRSSVVGKYSVLEDHCSIGANCEVIDSVIKSRVKIGHNCHVKGSFIGEASILEDNVSIGKSLVASKAYLCSGVVLKKFCIVGNGVCLPKGFELDDGQIASREKLSYFDDLDTLNVTHPSTGKIVRVFIYQSNISKIVQSSTTVHDCALITSSYPFTHEPIDQDEVSEYLSAAYKDHFSIDNVGVEIHSLRCAHAKTPPECACAIVICFVEIAIRSILPDYQQFSDIEPTESQITVIIEELSILLDLYSSVVLQFLGIGGRERQANEVLVIETIVDLGGEIEMLLCFFQQILHALYTADILSEDSILQWYRGALEEDDEEIDSIYARKCQVFVEWLENAEEESETESSDDDSSS